MIDDATLAEWEQEERRYYRDSNLLRAIAEIRRLRGENILLAEAEYDSPAFHACMEAYGKSFQQLKADLAAHRAVVRELANLLTNACTMRQDGGFVGDNIDRWLTSVILALANPLIQQAREEKL